MCYTRVLSVIFTYVLHKYYTMNACFVFGYLTSRWCILYECAFWMNAFFIPGDTALSLCQRPWWWMLHEKFVDAFFELWSFLIDIFFYVGRHRHVSLDRILVPAPSWVWSWEIGLVLPSARSRAEIHPFGRPSICSDGATRCITTERRTWCCVRCGEAVSRSWSRTWKHSKKPFTEGGGERIVWIKLAQGHFHLVKKHWTLPVKSSENWGRHACKKEAHF